jgi:hypothetical protein
MGELYEDRSAATRWSSAGAACSKVPARHTMPKPDPATRVVLLDYLAAAPPPKPQQQRGWVNPF